MAAAILAGISYFACVFSGGCVLGAIRLLLVRPAVGETVAVMFELPVILAWSWMVCGWLVQRQAVPFATTARLVMGGTAFIMLMLAEFALATELAGRSVGDWFMQYRHTPGIIGLLGQIAFGLFPLLR